VTIRPPTPADAPALGAVHVRSWQRAYRGGSMPDAYLDGLSADDRAQAWADALQGPARPGVVRLVSESEDGQLVGFIVVGPATGDPSSEHGEVYALNVDPAAWSGGHGRRLLEAGTAALTAAGFAEAVLWVHPDNARARSFYASAGWRPTADVRRQEVFGVEVPEVRYHRDLA
jgi:ribosomal protein S18 acetylase RimI-like enzyme